VFDNMIRKLDGLVVCLLATVFAAFLMFSCAAKEAPREIIVNVPAGFLGELSLSPCMDKSVGEVTLNAQGAGTTAACPRVGETLTLTVVKDGKSYRIPPDQVTIERAGDGLPVAIRARVP
jgi:hypothetical protein